MIAVPTGAARVDDALRVVRALGTHRYVAGRLHLVHAFALACVPEQTEPCLAAGRRWARQLLADGKVDASSRDESLRLRCSDAELVALLAVYWTPGPTAVIARQGLRQMLGTYNLPLPGGSPFDESLEDAMHPMLIDAGWELLALAQLDPERHKGAIASFGETEAFQSALVHEGMVAGGDVPLCELPAIGPAELLGGVGDGGRLVEPLVVWAGGNETYLDYVLRGVLRAAKIGG
ncbi:MAG: hypothetical protein M3O50_10300 [Myxococcota bacterium]|nr:hypothetical protein [Myxococcota bacterium]